MADLDEQSAVVSEEVTPEKKVKRARAAAAATNKKTASGKTGAKRVKKPAAKGQEPELNLNSAEKLPEPPSNHQTALETGTMASDVKAEPAAAIAQVSERIVRAGDNGRENNTQPEAAVITEQSRPEPVFGEGLIEVSGKGFGFLRDP
ncbi:MAG TPA: hypothetical protein VGH55_08315, partial [Chthoniobacterales bacterium]